MQLALFTWPLFMPRRTPAFPPPYYYYNIYMVSINPDLEMNKILMGFGIRRVFSMVFKRFPSMKIVLKWEK